MTHVGVDLGELGYVGQVDNEEVDHRLEPTAVTCAHAVREADRLVTGTAKELRSPAHPCAGAAAARRFKSALLR